jgi:hypothetical protein
MFCPESGTFWFKNTSPSRRNILLVDLLAVESAMQEAVVERTNAMQAHAWFRYTNYLTSIGCLQDPFLDNFSRAQRHRILAACAHAIRGGRFGSKNHPILKSEFIRATLDCVAQTFKLADKPDPRLDRENEFAFTLTTPA